MKELQIQAVLTEIGLLFHEWYGRGKWQYNETDIRIWVVRFTSCLVRALMLGLSIETIFKLGDEIRKKYE